MASEETEEGAPSGESLKALTPPLNPRRQRFVEEYVLDLNGTHAAIRAGYAPANAVVQASQLLSDLKVKAAIDAKLADRAKRSEGLQDRILAELERIAFAPPPQPEDALRYSDKLKAAELLGRHLAMWKDNLRVSGGLTLEQLVAESLKPAEKP